MSKFLPPDNQYLRYTPNKQLLPDSKTYFLKHLTCILLLCSFSTLFGQTDVLYRVSDPAYATTVAHTFTDGEVIPRLRSTESAIPTRYTEAVKGYLRTYTIKNRAKTERILGKSVMYFPIYEEQFRKSGIPDALKYLSVTESALNPVAISSASATGLWQFMKATGREYGLRIDQAVDERCDPHLSTAAAAAYLAKQYARFGDWALAIAAYNSGPGNVSKAIRRGRSKNFWKIKKYLPRETRSYVPGYIAAAYILQHYEKHGLTPQYPDMDLQLTEAVKVYQFLNFQTISSMTGLPVNTIKELNPSFLQNYIPATQRGYYLILPKRVMDTFKNQVARPDSKPVYAATNSNPIYTTPVSNNPVYRKTRTRLNKDNYSLSHHNVLHNENLQTIAKQYNCHPYHIKVWNDLKSNYVQPGKQLKIYVPKFDQATSAQIIHTPKQKINVPKISTLKVQGPISQYPSDIGKNPKKNKIKARRYLYHVIHRNESLRDISKQYNTSVQQILDFNTVKRGRLPMPGDKIKVKIIE